MNNNSKILLVFASGIALGAFAGLLYSPYKGSVTRKKLTKKGNAMVDGIGESIDKLGEDIKKTLGIAKENVENVVKKGNRKISQQKG
jgi:gas vesicle protein